LLAVVILKENISPLRWISIIVVTAGAIAIKACEKMIPPANKQMQLNPCEAERGAR